MLVLLQAVGWVVALFFCAAGIFNLLKKPGDYTAGDGFILAVLLLAILAGAVAFVLQQTKG